MSALEQIAASFRSTRPRDGKPTSGTSIDLRLTFHDGYGYIERINDRTDVPTRSVDNDAGMLDGLRYIARRGFALARQRSLT
jgi:hypothetical protein